jgi:mannose-6-phosphate isomerase-like protein (cupin superfamily)
LGKSLLPGFTDKIFLSSSGISFSTTSYTVAENTPSIAISVKRAGDASEAVSVDYAVTSGTAIDGEDFAATSGTLNWDANDSAAKTFDVQIFADDAVEGDETVTLALSNPSSNTSLGAENTATLNISDFVVGECNAEITNSKITEDTTLSEPCYKVPNSTSVQNPAQLTVSPGVKTQAHRHQKSEELYHISQGSGRMALGERTFNVEVGDTVLIPPGTLHSIENISNEPLKILCCCSPPYSHDDTELLEL